MTVTLDTIKARHSVRAYTDKPIEAEKIQALQAEIDACNSEGELSIKLVTNEPQAFDSTMAHYGKFSGVRNYVVLAGPKNTPNLEVRCGYYGERIALLAQDLGLNTCWVAMTFKKRYVKTLLSKGDKLVVVLALGYGETQGIEHHNKDLDQVSMAVPGSGGAPDWFYHGVQAALLAPTAMNQQSFKLVYTDKQKDGKPYVIARSEGGFYSKVDLGIVKYHFEIGAGKDNFVWPEAEADIN